MKMDNDSTTPHSCEYRYNRRLKIFRILSSTYRNRHRRFGLRANLIAGIYNYELEAKELEAKVDMKTE